MADQLSERQQRAAERILEDESLTEDLTDAPARALISWASEQASAFAGDEGRSDQELSDALKALRSAVRAAAASGETDGAVLVAQAQATLAASLGLDQEATSTPTSSADHKTSHSSPKTATESAKPARQPHEEKAAAQTHESQREDSKHKLQSEQAENNAKATGLAPLQIPDPPTRASTTVAKAEAVEQTPDEKERFARWLEDVASDEQE